MRLLDWLNLKRSPDHKPCIEWYESWEVERGDLEICHIYRCEYRGLKIKTICDNRWDIWDTYYFKDGKLIARKNCMAHKECPKGPSIRMANKIIAGLEYVERKRGESISTGGVND